MDCPGSELEIQTRNSVQGENNQVQGAPDTDRNNPIQDAQNINNLVQDAQDQNNLVQNTQNINNPVPDAPDIKPVQNTQNINNSVQNTKDIKKPELEHSYPIQDVQHPILNPIIRMVLQGVYDDTSPLAILRGIPHVLQIILKYVKNYWKSHIQIGEKWIRAWVPNDGEFIVKLSNMFSWTGDGKLNFPEPSDININMMPFILATSFEETFLPNYLKPYFDKLILVGLLANRMDIINSEMGKVCYLSIQESWVEQNVAQRRPGLHTESPGKLFINQEVSHGMGEFSSEYNVDLIESKEKTLYATRGKGSSAEFEGIHGWGMSMGYLQGGIYLASTVKHSCKLWDCQILPDEGEDGDIIGKFGDIEHLRNYLPEGEVMEENMMYWITDRTPHESLPLDNRTYRQWFRLVTSGVSLWFQDHSTKNPLGILPDPKITKIIKGSKFDEKNLVVVCPKNGLKQYKVKIKKKMHKINKVIKKGVGI